MGAMFTCVVVGVTVVIALDTKHWTWMNHFAYWVSLVFFFFFCYVYDDFEGNGMTLVGVIGKMWNEAAFWYTLVWSTFALVVLPMVGYNGYHECFKEETEMDPVDILRRKACYA